MLLELGAGVLTGLVGDFLGGGSDTKAKAYRRQADLALQSQSDLLDKQIADYRYEQYQRSQIALGQEQFVRRQMLEPQVGEDVLTRPLSGNRGFPRITF